MMVEDLKNIYIELQQEESKLNEIQTEVAYIYLKSMVHQAKTYNRMKDYLKSDKICEEVIKKIKSEIDGLQEPKKYWKFAVKASYIQAKQLINCMEFKPARQIFEEAKDILKKLIPKFYEVELKDELDLPHTPHSFEYRKKYANYTRRFAFYEDAKNQICQVIKDEYDYFKIPIQQQQIENIEEDKAEENQIENQEEEKEDTKDIEQQLPSLPILESLDEYLKQNKHILKPKSIPYLQLTDSYHQLGKVLNSQIKVNDSVKFFELSIEILHKVYGEQNLIQKGSLLNLIKESYLKDSGQRNVTRVESALKHAQQYNELFTTLLGENSNYFVAKSFISLGDAHQENEKPAEAEKYYHKAQVMIGEKFGDNHPIMLSFNSNLIEVYSQMESQEKKSKCILISQKNLEIAQQYYGPNSIYTLKYELAIASNYISSGDMQQSQVHVAVMRHIVQKYHDDDPKQLMNQYLFLGQVLIAMTLMSSSSADSAERILYYVMQKQLEYVNFCQTHPFLEQTVFNLAIYYRSSQQLQLSLRMWQNLEKIQENLYGKDKEVLVYTLKNIGICYLGLGLPDKSEESYLKSLRLLEKVRDQSIHQGNASEQKLKEDLEQIAAIYFNLYLSAITDDKKERAKEYNLKNKDFNIQLHGENSLNVSNNYFLDSQLSLKLGQPNKALESMQKAMMIFNNITETKIQKDELELISIRYHIGLANIYYILKMYQEANQEATLAAQKCLDETNFTKDTIQEVAKLKKETQSIALKSEAKIKQVSSLDLKKQQSQGIQEQETVVSSKILPISTLFTITSTSTCLITYFLLKNRI